MEKIRVGAVASPSTSKKTKTGDWRTTRPIFLPDLCTGCQMCVTVCPEGCISGEEKQFQSDMDYCKGCGICAEECPADAIKMVKEEK